MRTLHLDLGREMRGGQWQVLRLVRGLIAGGDEPTLMAREDGELLKHARAEGLPVRAFSALALPQLSRQFDLVHAHDARSHGFAALFPRRPLVVARRVAFPIGTGFLSAWKYKRADLYIAVSQHVAAMLTGVPSQKIVVVHDGVPLLPETSREGTVVALPLKDRLRNSTLLGKLPIAHSLDRDLTSATALVYISDSEGLGSAVLLAMSAGVPVIASNVGGIPEIIEHGADGLLIENSQNAISAAVAKLLPDALEFGTRARAKIAARFSEARMVDDTVSAYRKLLSHV